MGKRDFDNLIKIIQSGLILNAGTLVSVELDFELPRGFIAKLKFIFLEWIDLHEDLEGATGEKNLGVTCALMRDPDDITTQSFPDNIVQHDVIASANWSFNARGEAAPDIQYQMQSINRKEIRFDKDDDVITARNMRFNAVGLGTDVTDLTESAARVEIYYTLEEVTDADILELLDIL